MNFLIISMIYYIIKHIRLILDFYMRFGDLILYVLSSFMIINEMISLIYLLNIYIFID